MRQIMIPLPSDSWLWIVDDELVQAMFEAAPGHSGLSARAAAEPEMVTAVRHWLRSEPAAALAALEPAVERGNPDALLLAAQLQFESGDPEKAATLYGRLAEAVPDHSYASFNVGLCHVRLRQWRQAAEALQRAVVLTPSHTEAWYLLGVALLHEGRMAEAASAFGQSLALRPGYAPSLCGKAAALQLQGKAKEALEAYLSLLEAAPQREELLLNALRAAVEAGDWPQVRQLAMRVSALSPGSLPAREALAHADFAEGKYQEALAAFQGLAAAAPAFLEPWYQAGVCLFRLGRYEEAVGAFQSALQVDGRHEGTRLALAEALRMAGRTGEALAVLQGVTEQNGASREAWIRLGLLEADNGRLPEALRALEQVLRPGVAAEDAELADLQAAVAALLQEKGEYARAAELYQLAMAVRSEDAVLLFNYGSTVASLDRVEEAQAAWKEALARDRSLAGALIMALEPQPVRIQRPAKEQSGNGV